MPSLSRVLSCGSVIGACEFPNYVKVTATNCSHSGVAREHLATFPQLDNTTTGSILAARRRSTAEFYISYELGPTFHIVYEPNPNP